LGQVVWGLSKRVGTQEGGLKANVDSSANDRVKGGGGEKGNQRTWGVRKASEAQTAQPRRGGPDKKRKK